MKSSKNAPKQDASAIEARQQRIAEIRKQLAEGTYQISSQDVATAILNDMLEREAKKHQAA